MLGSTLPRRFGLILLASVLAAIGNADQQPDSINLSAWTLQLHAALKSEATTRETADHPAAAIKLCQMCASMRLDDRYATSKVLQALAARARRRLMDVREDVRLSLKRDGIEKPKDFDLQLQQLDAAIARYRTAGNAAAEVPSAAQNPSAEEGFSAATGGGFGPAADNGFMLMELITRTVSPEFWNTQGGPGVAYYYGLQRVLVVRATTPVHEDIQSLLQALGGLPR